MQVLANLDINPVITSVECSSVAPVSEYLKILDIPVPATGADTHLSFDWTITGWELPTQGSLSVYLRVPTSGKLDISLTPSGYGDYLKPNPPQSTGNLTVWHVTYDSGVVSLYFHANTIESSSLRIYPKTLKGSAEYVANQVWVTSLPSSSILESPWTQDTFLSAAVDTSALNISTTAVPVTFGTVVKRGIGINANSGIIYLAPGDYNISFYMEYQNNVAPAGYMTFLMDGPLVSWYAQAPLSTASSPKSSRTITKHMQIAYSDTTGTWPLQCSIVSSYAAAHTVNLSGSYLIIQQVRSLYGLRDFTLT